MLPEHGDCHRCGCGCDSNHHFVDDSFGRYAEFVVVADVVVLRCVAVVRNGVGRSGVDCANPFAVVVPSDGVPLPRVADYFAVVDGDILPADAAVAADAGFPVGVAVAAVAIALADCVAVLGDVVVLVVDAVLVADAVDSAVVLALDGVVLGVADFEQDALVVDVVPVSGRFLGGGHDSFARWQYRSLREKQARQPSKRVQIV